MNANEFTSELRKAVDTFDRTGAARLCQTLIKHLVTSDEDYPVKEAERALQILRNKRMFALMRRVGDAFIQTDRASLKVRRQYAQSLIDEGDLSAALSVLTELAVVANKDPVENAEVRGLIGRVHKQFYLNAGNPKLTVNREHLRRAIASYVDVYSADPPSHLWHGINVVACVKRAIRDGVPTDGFPTPEKLAAEILIRIETKQDDRTADAWDFATAVEACVALERHEESLKWVDRYTSAPYTDAFELASTLRQLTELWQLDASSPPGSTLLPILRATLLNREGGQIEVTQHELRNEGRSQVRTAYEKVFGNDSYQTYKWYMEGAHCCEFIARIGRDATQGYGTGFAVKGSDLWKEWGDEPVLLTNAHVLTDDVNIRDALRLDEAIITFEAHGPEEFHAAMILWTSPPDKLDATVLRLEGIEKLKGSLKPPPLRCAKALPLVEDSARVYVIGHPRGGTLSISLQDNLLLDHESPRIHYRTPTEGGSSGSPVFNRQWSLIGLHHAGSETMPMLNNKQGTYAANEGIWIQAIIQAIATRDRRA